MDFTQVEIDEMYTDYRNGWQLGALGGSRLDAAGTPEPAFPAEWERGLEDGHSAFAAAMKAQLERLKHLKKT